MCIKFKSTGNNNLNMSEVQNFWNQTYPTYMNRVYEHSVLGLADDANNSSGYIVSIGSFMYWEGFSRIDRGLIRFHPAICLKGLKKTMKNVNRDLQFPCADFLSIIAA
jgi:hypothetical protein